jgi:hypothetical protein
VDDLLPRLGRKSAGVDERGSEVNRILLEGYFDFRIGAGCCAAYGSSYLSHVTLHNAPLRVSPQDHNRNHASLQILLGHNVFVSRQEYFKSGLLGPPSAVPRLLTYPIQRPSPWLQRGLRGAG